MKRVKIYALTAFIAFSLITPTVLSAAEFATSSISNSDRQTPLARILKPGSGSVKTHKPRSIKRSEVRFNSRGKAPLAYQLFCLKSPRECRGGGKASVHLTPQLLSKLDLVNRSVNRAIRPRNDFQADTWSLSPASGDCEDYALTKRQRLLKLGVPASALRLAVARTGRGEGHAVLVVRTSSGDRILDNRTNLIRNWHQTDLRLVKMAGANPLKWH
ncbi:transglutaminase-like cysteine peptidase [Mesorhizobium sp. WSM2239]|uniref:Transglutaminase-like cysteine peptidase n=2 Tax=unclassified Mesorhizobium TaxID=325217 RepID=A0AAU8DGY4_9HYPH